MQSRERSIKQWAGIGQATVSHLQWFRILPASVPAGVRGLGWPLSVCVTVWTGRQLRGWGEPHCKGVCICYCVYRTPATWLRRTPRSTCRRRQDAVPSVRTGSRSTRRSAWWVSVSCIVCSFERDGEFRGFCHYPHRGVDAGQRVLYTDSPLPLF